MRTFRQEKSTARPAFAQEWNQGYGNGSPLDPVSVTA
jgi:hypothetical protein